MHMIEPADKGRFLAELETAVRALETKIGPDRFVRPFVCDGSLTSCDIFIVGVNPRENMAFRPFWNGHEYNKNAWEKEYLWQRYKRAIADMAAGREPDAIASKTRKKIEVFCQSAFPIRVLETNIYPVSTDKEKELELHPGYMDHSVFALLLRELQPRVIIAQGATARTFISQLLGIGVIASGGDPEEFTKARPWNALTYLKALKHLGGRAGSGYSYEWMSQFGAHVRSLLLPTT
jgi:hypothetical protein